jgi:cold shock CspA family protein
MSSTSEQFSLETRYNGQVKWFNNKAGYGFITMSHNNQLYDIFVHHSSLIVSQEQYKYLVQGEYVEFNISRITSEHSHQTPHEWQASDVTGFNRGFLMCETRYSSKTQRRQYTKTTPDTTASSDVNRETPQTTRNSQRPAKQFVRTNTNQTSTPQNIPIKVYGEGPRSSNGGQWLLVHTSDKDYLYKPNQHQTQPRRRNNRTQPYQQQAQA